jgi:putative oxidoreductase
MERRSHRKDLGLLIFRSALGLTLAAHGAQKLFGWFGGPGVAGTSSGMKAMGFLDPKTSAVMAGLSEAGGGTLLTLGLATPVAGSAAASTMLAAGSVHWSSGFFATKGGYEYNAILGIGGAALAIGGPGYYSLDRLLDDRLNQPWMAAVALTVFGAASAAIVARRQQALAAAEVATPSEP